MFFSDDHMPPQVLVNKELKLLEGSSELITTELLSARDSDSPATSLTYSIVEPPKLGHLAFVQNPGKQFKPLLC